MLNNTAPYRRDDRSTMRVPVVMPLVEVTVDADGYLTVVLDREPYVADNTLRRDGLRPLLEGIAADLCSPVRVEVHEANDVLYADIVIPNTPAPDSASVRSATSRAKAVTCRAVTGTALASTFGVSAEGFIAGEHVHVCLVVARQAADPDGTAQLRLPPALLAEHPEVVLVGRTSGVVAFALSEGVA
jgi:hypothetical protein